MSLADLLSLASRAAGFPLSRGDLSPAATRHTQPVREGRYAINDGHDWFFADFRSGQWQDERLRSPVAKFVWYGLNMDVRQLINGIVMQKRPNQNTSSLAHDATSSAPKAVDASSQRNELDAWARAVLTNMRAQVLSSLAALAAEAGPGEMCADEIDRASARIEYEAALHAREAQQS